MRLHDVIPCDIADNGYAYSRREHIFPRNSRRKKHYEEHEQKYHSRTVIALKHDYSDGEKPVNAQKQHIKRLVQAVSDFVEVKREAHDERDFEYFGGLELDEAEVEPADIVRALNAYSERRKRFRYIVP